jgi:hypothetical protein
MKHTLRVEVAPIGCEFLQVVEDEDYDPENRIAKVMMADAWDELVHNSFLGSLIEEFQERAGQDDWITMYFDGECVADEFAAHVPFDYFDDQVVR